MTNDAFNRVTTDGYDHSAQVLKALSGMALRLLALGAATHPRLQQTAAQECRNDLERIAARVEHSSALTAEVRAASRAVIDRSIAHASVYLQGPQAMTEAAMDDDGAQWEKLLAAIHGIPSDLTIADLLNITVQPNLTLGEFDRSYAMIFCALNNVSYRDCISDGELDERAAVLLAEHVSAATAKLDQLLSAVAGSAVLTDGHKHVCAALLAAMRENGRKTLAVVECAMDGDKINDLYEVSLVVQSLGNAARALAFAQDAYYTVLEKETARVAGVSAPATKAAAGRKDGPAKG